ncbi:hypothetical protein CSPAE12_01468 [Colletotrichum incanum]|nr:hypothetical protein CSPAE12_01468 [Colletotrichum incanum]
MLDSLLCHLLIFLHQLRDEREAVIEGWRNLADVGCDDVLQVCALLALQALEDGVADLVDLGLVGQVCGCCGAIRRCLERSGSALRILVHGLGDILFSIAS